VFVTLLLVDALLPLCYRLCVVARRFCSVLTVSDVFDGFKNLKGSGSVKPKRVCLLCRCGSIYGVGVVKVNFVVAMVVVVAKVDFVKVTSIVVVVTKVVVVFSI